MSSQDQAPRKKHVVFEMHFSPVPESENESEDVYDEHSSHSEFIPGEHANRSCRPQQRALQATLEDISPRLPQMLEHMAFAHLLCQYSQHCIQ